jgi:hypothetical protein
MARLKERQIAEYQIDWTRRLDPLRISSGIRQLRRPSSTPDSVMRSHDTGRLLMNNAQNLFFSPLLGRPIPCLSLLIPAGCMLAFAMRWNTARDDNGPAFDPGYELA